MSTLVIAEHDNKTLNQATLCAITAAQEISPEITLFAAGYNCDAVISELSKVDGVAEILYANAEHFAHPLAENLTAQILSSCTGFTHIIAPATTFGKNVLPRLAAKLDVGANL